MRNDEYDKDDGTGLPAIDCRCHLVEVDDVDPLKQEGFAFVCKTSSIYLQNQFGIRTAFGSCGMRVCGVCLCSLLFTPSERLK